ncbi:MAG TPA: helix-turn-helix domain-containing protein [Acidimicrobiia bacterium]|nr:helix-turn-helix domain-containing protein [Acidimicrobiia bacterium]
MSGTLTIPEVAALLGLSRNTAYEAARSGEIAGVPVISVGRRLLVPRKPLLELLGEDEDPAAAGPSTVSSRIPGIPAPPVDVSDDHRHEPL